MDGLTAQQIIDIIFSQGSISYKVLLAVEKGMVILSGSLAFIGGLMWLVSMAARQERVIDFDELLKLFVMPAVTIALLMPASGIGANHGIGVEVVKFIFQTSAWMTDHLTNKVAIFNPEYEWGTGAKTTGTGAKFTELATGFRETAEKATEDLAKQVEKDLKIQLEQPNIAERHPTVLAGIIGLILGATSAAVDAAKISLSVSSIFKKGLFFLYTAGGGVAGATKFALTTALLGYSVDIIWRFIIILWVIKVVAIVLLTPIAIGIGLIAYGWGYGNIGRFFLNVIGIAITPIAMVTILVGSYVAYSLALSIVSGLPIVAETLFRMFLAIAFPVVVAMALLRAGEIVSYVIGTTAFAMSSIAQIYTRPSQIVQDMKPM